MRSQISTNSATQLDMGPAVRWATIAAFGCLLALLGGSSRGDSVQIVALRPIAALFLIPALYWLSSDALKDVRGLLMMSGLAIVWVALQLVPLPPFIWQALPDRSLIADIDLLTGMEDAWRPISLTPTRSLDTLASLIVPISGAAIALTLRLRAHEVLMVVAAIGVVDALLGLAQVATGSWGGLYFYAITNAGSPVGIFANENHSAVFSSIVLLVIARLSVDHAFRTLVPTWRMVSMAAFGLVLIAGLISSSRAGLVMTVFTAVLSAGIFWLSTNGRSAGGPVRKSAKLLEWMQRNSRFAVPLVIALLATPIAGFVLLENLPGYESIFATSPFEDLRWKMWPTLELMMRTHWLVGTGFGSFEEVYHIYEPTELLLPSYVNQAHNDWAQLVIEGGLPAIVLLVVGLFGFGRTVKKLFGASDVPLSIPFFWLAIIAVIAAASIVDYPLRIPVFQTSVIWILLAFCIDKSNSERSKS